LSWLVVSGVPPSDGDGDLGVGVDVVGEEVEGEQWVEVVHPLDGDPVVGDQPGEWLAVDVESVFGVFAGL